MRFATIKYGLTGLVLLALLLVHPIKDSAQVYGNGYIYSAASCIGGICPVTAFGAKCDGATDDTAAFNLAIAAATPGGIVEVPPQSTCNVSSLTLSGISGITVTSGSWQYGVKTTGGIQFTGTPTTCSNGTGGLLQIINKSTDVLFENIQLFQQHQGATTNCFINISGVTGSTSAARIWFNRVFIGGNVPSNDIAMFLSEVVNLAIRDSYFNDNVFSQHIVQDTTATNTTNHVIISGNRFGSLATAVGFGYMLDFNDTSSAGGTQALSILNNEFEQNGNQIRVANGTGTVIQGNWSSDAFAIAKWTANGAVFANTCVVPTAYFASTSFIFCTMAAGTMGAGEPTWNVTPGSTTADNGISWINSGSGVAADLGGSGVFTGNHWFGGGAIGLKLESTGFTCGTSNNKACNSGWLVSGNKFARSAINYILDNASGSEITGNTFQSTTTVNIVSETGSGMLVIGDGTTVVDAVKVGPQVYVDATSTAIPWLKLAANSEGSAFYDTFKFAVGRFTDSSSGAWDVDFGGTSPSISGGGALAAGSTRTKGTITSCAAATNVLTPGFTCPNKVIGTFTDETNPSSFAWAGSNATTITFNANAGGTDVVDYVVGCR